MYVIVRINVSGVLVNYFVCAIKGSVLLIIILAFVSIVNYNIVSNDRNPIVL